MFGARQGGLAGLRRLVAGAAARELAAFVVPGVEVAQARGLDVEAAGLWTSGAPRHASVLLVVGEIPEKLREAAAVVYAQMMRPRALLAVGAGELSPLPAPDVSVALTQHALAAGVTKLRRSFATNAWRTDTEDFRAGEVLPEEDDEESGHAGHDHGSHGDMDHGSEEHDHGSMSHDGEHDHAQMEHGGHMDHGDDMGFMSMVAMTKDLPRSSDGLRMEWVEAPFGPLFPGLPGGLRLSLTLDGDTVAGVEAGTAVGIRPHDLIGPVGSFADRLAGLVPLSPVAYRVLVWRALEDAAGAEVEGRAALARVGALERERAASHLGWLSGLGYLIGYRWLSRRAAKLQLAVLRADGAGVSELRTEARRLARRIERTPLLRRRLEGVGSLPGDAKASGPVARAAGSGIDARSGEAAYLALDFEPVVREGNDALARLRVRLAEVERSLEISEAVGFGTPSPLDWGGAEGAATVETPRGAATLRVTLAGDGVSAVELETPSTRHIELVAPVCEQRELADALVGVASLDLSPWEVVRR